MDKWKLNIPRYNVTGVYSPIQMGKHNNIVRVTYILSSIYTIYSYYARINPPQKKDSWGKTKEGTDIGPFPL